MKIIINVCFTVLLLIAETSEAIDSSKQPYHVPEIEVVSIKSKYVDQTFELKIMQPISRKDGTERFPVLYMTDGNLMFDALKDISHSLQFSGVVPRFILVGISYPGDNPFGGFRLRRRDLSWYDVPDVLPWLVEGVHEIPQGKSQTGAPEFLQFIREELIPMVDSNYPTISGERAYYGFSRGGGFGLYTLFHKPDTFSRYILASSGVDDYQGENTPL